MIFVGISFRQRVREITNKIQWYRINIIDKNFQTRPGFERTLSLTQARSPRALDCATGSPRSFIYIFSPVLFTLRENPSNDTNILEIISFSYLI